MTALLALFAPLALAGGGPENVLLVVNKDSPGSIAVASYYMQRRDIPRHHVVYVSFDKNQWRSLPTFEVYKERLEDPVRAWRKAHPKAAITIILLSRDVPLTAPLTRPKDPKVKVRDFHKGTAHLLATMDATDPVRRDATKTMFGVWPISPYYRSNVSIDPRTPIRQNFPLLCVGVLNAFEVETAKAMVDRAIRAEAKRPVGTIYLGQSKQGDPRGCYNNVFPQMLRVLQGANFKAEIIPHPGSGKLLQDKQDVLFYMFGQAGWDKTFPAANRYVDGAVVDNLTSVALTPNHFFTKYGGQTSMCHFLAAGATAVHGCVREPYTIAFDGSHTHIFRYLAGYNLIESYYMSHRLLPWMNLVSGDPLLQPFVKRPQVVEVGFESGKWRVKATPTFEPARTKIRAIRCYVDGVLVAEQPGPEAAFELAGVDTRVSRLVAVAIDDSPIRAQGRLVREPPRVAVGPEAIKLSSVTEDSATFELGGELIASWYAPDAIVRRGVIRGRTLTLKYAGKVEGAVDIWLHHPNREGGVTPHRRIDIQGEALRVALAAARKARSDKNWPALVKHLQTLGKLDLDPASQAELTSWRKELGDLSASEWKAIADKLPRKLRAAHVERVRDYIKRFAGTPTAAEAQQELDRRLSEFNRRAAPLLEKAEELAAAGRWYEARDAYETVSQRYPLSNQAVIARDKVKAIEADPKAARSLARGAREKEAADKLREALNLKRNRRKAQARKILEELVRDYADTEAGREARDELD